MCECEAKFNLCVSRCWLLGFFVSSEGDRRELRSQAGAAACSWVISRGTQQLNTSRKLGLRSLLEIEDLRLIVSNMSTMV